MHAGVEQTTARQYHSVTEVYRNELKLYRWDIMGQQSHQVTTLQAGLRT